MSWTDERIALLTKLWGEGKTAAEIASELGGVTRNAVIGKAHRLKLSNRVSPIQQNKKPAAAPPAKTEKKAPRAVAPRVDEKGEYSLLELAANQCRWPVGDPQEEEFGFCGAQKDSSGPYCEEHAKVAYQAPGRMRALKAADFEDKKPRDTDDEAEEAEIKVAVSQ